MGEKVRANNEGIVLVIVLILSLVCLLLILGLFYMLRTSTAISGSVKRYTTALEAAKGTINLIIAAIQEGIEFDCNSTNSTEGCSVTLPISRLGDYEINACLLNKEQFLQAKAITTVYTFRVKAKRLNEEAVIDFVYRYP